MGYELTPFKAGYIEDAVGLMAAAYAEERLANPDLPDTQRLGDGRGVGYFRERLQELATSPGVAAFQSGVLCGFMLESLRFVWKGQGTAQSDELSHAAHVQDREVIYRILYREMAQRWVEEGQHLHIVGHFAHDLLLRDTLYHLGFGAILAERVRDLASIPSQFDVDVVQNPTPASLLDLQREHIRYYPQSPIFLRRDDSDAELLAELEEHLTSGDRLFACAQTDEIVALFIVGESTPDGEGRLLRQTNSAQLKSAYVRPAARGKGIGAALLDHSIRWANEQGFDRIFVEHETANIPGSAFWANYFDPYLYISTRYVDNTL